ncbi:hypothetical protein B0H16DRAFT_1728797 [Mycena metata]|uniref:Uncharacterized protein n=1 Tax=Mycena metata TaxID=1033252 RepID=A0AAD7IF08_9AGAR|nr:hypothetical protein B0H16DRAFT_1728797 [Mycena metata]
MGTLAIPQRIFMQTIRDTRPQFLSRVNLPFVSTTTGTVDPARLPVLASWTRASSLEHVLVEIRKYVSSSLFLRLAFMHSHSRPCPIPFPSAFLRVCTRTRPLYYDFVPRLTVVYSFDVLILPSSSSSFHRCPDHSPPSPLLHTTH